MGMTRTEFIRAASLVGAGVGSSVAVAVKDRIGSKDRDPIGADTRREVSGLREIAEKENEDVLMRMQREMAKALKKPVEQRQWIMVIDSRKCVGCHACTIACVAENKLPPGVVYRPVITEVEGEFPNIKMKHTPRPCMQCHKPPCTPVCPVNATWKRPDGIVVVDYDRCIGCRYCLTACPYGARTSDFGLNYQDDAADGAPEGEDRPLFAAAPNERLPNHEYGKSWNRDKSDHASPKGNARKCHFCLHRLEEGKLPQCSTSCIGRANYFGDANDPDSLVKELITKNNVQTLLTHKGTDPRVYYIV